MKKLIALVGIVFICFVACRKEQSSMDFILPSSSAMNDANRFAVVIETYVSLKDKPGDDGITLVHARRRDIFKVLGLEIIDTDDEQELWVHLEDGWLPRENVQIYSSEAKARTAARDLK